MVKREIAFFDFKREHAGIQQEISDAIERVFESGRFVL
jgi:hypothetical protein